jgi:CheY-like chemotaxis protein
VRTGRIGAAEAAAVGLTEAFAGAVWIAIKDQSPGYPYERREQICQALKNGILDNCPDIAFVLESVQRHEGTLLLETQAGRGTTWTLYLPALLGFENDFSFTEQMPATDCKGTILLVDDEPLICGVGRRVLESSGYRVITALSGTAAIDAYRRHADDVDLVLLDVILPDQGGLEVLKAIRRMNRSAKVLIASGYATEGGIRDTLNETGAGFVQKPYRVKELLAKVEKALLQ